MGRPVVRLVLGLLAAGLASFLLGLGFVELVARLPCSGERLACNIDAAVGGYGVIIWAVLGPLVFGVTLLVARNRTALLGATIVLLLPLLAFYLLGEGEHWYYVGFAPHSDARTFAVMLLPPVLAVVVQYLILRLVVPHAAPAAVPVA
ncbi:MAG: hypothetical protein ACRECX_12925 [Methyloceanibacter sp.]|uniref:hypothetical protein n=1 Tax=Methyloceanibacter sp. TaxID=1965321 RepID=UPI003D6CFDF9